MFMFKKLFYILCSISSSRKTAPNKTTFTWLYQTTKGRGEWKHRIWGSECSCPCGSSLDGNDGTLLLYCSLKSKGGLPLHCVLELPWERLPTDSSAKWTALEESGQEPVPRSLFLFYFKNIS